MDRPIVALLGKVGHGKTSLINKLCKSRFPSGMGAGSVTEHIQLAEADERFFVVDTPGFYASEDITGHIAAQKVALESLKLSGVYIVVKYGRADDIAELVSNLMDVVGTEDVRILITHEDIVEDQEGFDPNELKTRLAQSLGVPIKNVGSFGKHSPRENVMKFVESTMHEPKSYELSEEQLGQVANLAVGSRRIIKPINEIMAKIHAGTVACQEATAEGRGHWSDLIIISTQRTIFEEVNAAKLAMFRSVEGMEESDQHLVYGKAGVVLSLRLKSFMITTNKMMSYDVTDPREQRNMYKRCNYCGVIFNKTEGCDGVTTCGAVPVAMKNRTVAIQPRLEQHNGRWTISYMYGAVWYNTRSLYQALTNIDPLSSF